MQAAKRRSEEASRAAATRKPPGNGPFVGPKPKEAVAERRPPPKRPLLQHLVRVKPAAGQGIAPGTHKLQPSSAPSKRHKGDEVQGQLAGGRDGDESSGSDEGGGLAGLLGDYGSSSESG